MSVDMLYRALKALGRFYSASKGGYLAAGVVVVTFRQAVFSSSSCLRNRSD